MNARTAKLIGRYASKTGKNARNLKREWLLLTRKERTDRRRQIKAETGS